MSDESEFEPIIILSPEDYEKATAPAPAPEDRPADPPLRPEGQEVAEKPKRARPAPPPPRRSILRPLLCLAALLLLTIGGVAAYEHLPTLDAPLPAPGPLLTRRTSPKPPAPPRRIESDAAPAPAPPTPAVAAPRPAPPPPNSAPEPARPSGSFHVRVVLDGGGVHQDAVLAVKAEWDGIRYRFDADASAAFERVRLLLAMPPTSAGAGGRTETVTVGADSCECRFREDGEARLWELGHPSRAIVRLESPVWRREPVRISREPVAVVGGSLDCLAIDGEDSFAGGRRRHRQWFSAEFQFGALRAEQTAPDLVVRCEVVDFRIEK